MTPNIFLHRLNLNFELFVLDELLVELFSKLFKFILVEICDVIMELFLTFIFQNEDYSFFDQSHRLFDLICDEFWSELIDPVSDLIKIGKLSSEEINCLCAKVVIFFCSFMHLNYETQHYKPYLINKNHNIIFF